MSALDLQTVLAALRPGRVVRLELTREQKRALRDRDGQIALDGLRGGPAIYLPPRDGGRD